MKRILCLFFSLILLYSINACGTLKNSILENNTSENNTLKNSTLENKEENDMPDIEIVVGNQTFSAVLYDNETTKAFLHQLPVTLDMSELNGNEKYYYLSENLPKNSNKLSNIHTGDLMLYGNNCLVLFYKNFSTSYSYTPLGYIDDTEGLEDALGKGNITVTFQLK